jgi:formylglycine-generating enzyme required for sulfatase activity
LIIQHFFLACIKEREFILVYDYLKYKQAAYAKFNRNKDRKQYVKSEAIEIYPDTMVWIRDFTYSYNEPMTRQYFSHPAFDNYPVVGVRWEQANAFCHWRTEMLESYLKTKKKTMIDPFRLPSEHEW